MIILNLNKIKRISERKEKLITLGQDINEAKLKTISQRSNKGKKTCLCILVLPDICLMEEEIDFSASAKIGMESGLQTSPDFVEARTFVRLAQMLYKNGQGKTS